jgi:hypothetical protein
MTTASFIAGDIILHGVTFNFSETLPIATQNRLQARHAEMTVSKTENPSETPTHSNTRTGFGKKTLRHLFAFCS